MSEIKLDKPTKDISQAGFNDLGFRNETNEAQVVVQNGIINPDIQEYLNSIAVEEVITTGIINGVPLAGTLYTGTKDFYFTKTKKEPPRVLVFVESGGSTITLQLPSFTFFSYDTTYQGYPLRGVVDYTVYRDRVSVRFISDNTFAASSNIYVLRDKQTAQTVI